LGINKDTDLNLIDDLEIYDEIVMLDTYKKMKEMASEVPKLKEDMNHPNMNDCMRVRKNLMGLRYINEIKLRMESLNYEIMKNSQERYEEIIAERDKIEIQEEEQWCYYRRNEQDNTIQKIDFNRFEVMKTWYSYDDLWRQEGEKLLRNKGAF
jgi:hypothetical protein